MIYQFDDSYAGFLTAVFDHFEYKHKEVTLQSEKEPLISLFDEVHRVYTDEEKSERVRLGLIKKAGARVASDCYRCFLSEDMKAIQGLFELIINIFKNGPLILKNYGDPTVLYYHQTIKKVNRERHRMQAFIRFQTSTDGIYFAVIDPDFNVLPILITFFKDRYADQEWMIYDTKRDYGVLYDKKSVSEVRLDTKDFSSSDTNITLTEEEIKYQDLWKLYFKSTNIVERKNMKLHLRHVPRRYWKYLIEKQ